MGHLSKQEDNTLLICGSPYHTARVYKLTDDRFSFHGFVPAKPNHVCPSNPERRKGKDSASIQDVGAECQDAFLRQGTWQTQLAALTPGLDC